MANTRKTKIGTLETPSPKHQLALGTSSLGLMALEPRLLLDAAGAVTGAEGVVDALSQDAIDGAVDALFDTGLTVAPHDQDRILTETDFDADALLKALQASDAEVTEDPIIMRDMTTVKSDQSDSEIPVMRKDPGSIDSVIPVMRDPSELSDPKLTDPQQSDDVPVMRDLSDVPTEGFENIFTVMPTDAGEGTANLGKAPLDSIVDIPVMPVETASTIFVVIDTSVDDWDTLLSEAQDSYAGQDVNLRILLIEEGEDGVLALETALEGLTDVSAIHILSHGTSGALNLGTATLTAETIAGVHGARLASIRMALSDTADILIYGCDFGQDVFAVNALALATGADIAASNDDTGSAALGGDWDLEIKTGDIEAEIIALTDFAGLLATVPATVTPDSVTSSDAEVSGLDNTIDGDPAGPLFAQDFTSDVSNVTYNFATGQDGVTDIVIWNNAGGNLTDGQSIGAIETVNVRDTDGNIVLTLTNVTVPEGAAGDPFTLNLGASIDNVGSIELLNLTGTSGGLGGIAWREVAIIKQLLDTDGDGIADINDVDDDNDGILDTLEQRDPPILTRISSDVGAVNWPGDTDTTVTTDTSLIRRGTAFSRGGGGFVLADFTDPVAANELVISVVDMDRHRNGSNYTVTLVVTGDATTQDFTLQNPAAGITYDPLTGVVNIPTNLTTSGGSNVSVTFVSNSNASVETARVSFAGGRSQDLVAVVISGAERFLDTDNDGISDHLDIDSDNDGITDNIEAQSTAGYIAPSGVGSTITDANMDGLDDNYDARSVNGILDASASAATEADVIIVPVDTDNDGDADYLDTDSDNEGGNDTEEAGLGIGSAGGFSDPTNDADGDGLFDIFETQNGTGINDGFNVNESIATGALALPDIDGDAGGGVPLSEDVDFRDTSDDRPDTDGDGVIDELDVDDDNDGILDVDEGFVTVESLGLSTTESTLSLISTNANIIDPRVAFNDVRRIADGNQSNASGLVFNGTLEPGEDTVFTLGLNVVEGDVVDTFELRASVRALNDLDVRAFDLVIRDLSGAVVFSTSVPDTGPTGTAPATVTGFSLTQGFYIVEFIPQTHGAFSATVSRSDLIAAEIAELSFVGVTSTGMQIQTPGERDTDNDGIADHLDIDSDNDGITDNIEAQSTAGYIAPNADEAATYAANNGLNSAYLASNGLAAVDTDGDGDVDYLDTDSDDDGRDDTFEAGLGNSPVSGLSNAATDSDGDGLFDVFDTQNGTAADDGFDVNESIATGAAALPDADGDAGGGVPLSEDVDFRDVPTSPVVDLNSAASDTDTDRGFTSEYTSGIAAVSIVDIDADALEGSDVAGFTFLTITPTSALPDGANEILQVAGVDIRLNADFAQGGVTIPGTSTVVDISYVDGILTVREGSNGIISNADMDALIRSVTYRNEAANLDDSIARTFDFQVAQYDPSTFIIDFEEFTAGERVTSAQIESSVYWGSEGVTNTGQDTLNGYVAAEGVRTSSSSSPLGLAANADGNFLFHNTFGAVPTGENVVFGRSDISVDPNTEYTISLDLGRINSAAAGPFQIVVDDVVIGTVSNIPTNNFQTYTFSFTSGNTSSVDFEIRNLSTNPTGNDFGIDNISFQREPLILSNVATATVDLISAVPPEAEDDAFTIHENPEGAETGVITNGNLLADNGSDVDSDANGDTLSITQIDGVDISNGQQITLASGALLTIRTDGTFDYDPNGAFDSLDTGETATETFTYTLSDGTTAPTDTATVAITINGDNDAPTIDLNGPNSTGSDFTGEFVEDSELQPLARLVSGDAIIQDDENNITQVTITPNLPFENDGDAEFLRILTDTIDLSIRLSDGEITANTPLVFGNTTFLISYNAEGEIVITNAAGGTFDTDDLEGFVRLLSYENVDQNNSPGERSFEFAVIDSANVATAVSTLTVARTNDAPVPTVSATSNGTVAEVGSNVEPTPILIVTPESAALSDALTEAQVLGRLANGETAADLNLIAVSDLLAQLDIADAEQTEFGIGIISANEDQGRWQYLRTDVPGHEWTDFQLGDPDNTDTTPVPDGQVLLMSANTILRFVPNPGFLGGAEIQFRVWDGTEGTASNPPSTVADNSGGTAPLNSSSLSSAAFSAMLAADTDGDGIINADDVDDDNDGILDVDEGLIDYTLTGPIPDGVEDTGFPVGYWSVQYYEGRTPIPDGGSGGTATVTHIGEAYFGFGKSSTFINIGGVDNTVPLGENYIAEVPGFVASSTPISGAPGDYEVVHRRTVTADGTLSFGGRPVDDALRVVIDGVVVFNHYPGAGSPDPRPGDPPFTPVNIAVSAGSEVEIIYQNLGGQGGYAFTLNTPTDNVTVRDTDADGIADHLDIDSDNDGITDNIEAQTTAGYIAPSGTQAGITDVNNDGLDDNYDSRSLANDGAGLTATSAAATAAEALINPVNSDAGADTPDATPDYLDTDSDNDGINDADEAGHGEALIAHGTLSNATTDSDDDGLFDVFEAALDGNTNDRFVVNEGISPLDGTLADAGGDASMGTATPLMNDLDYRDLNDAPIAQDDEDITTADSTLAGNVFFNNNNGVDSDPDGDTISVIVGGDITAIGSQITLSSGALLWLNADGTYIYDANGVFDNLTLGQSGTDSFTYMITDPNGETSTATATITVLGVNDDPDAVDDTLRGGEDTLTSFNVFDANAAMVDRDPDGDTFTVTRVLSGNNVALLGSLADGTGVAMAVAGSNGGLFTIAADGTATFDPNGEFEGLAVGQTQTTHIVYQIDDGNGSTDSAVVTYTVTGVNDLITPVIPGDPNPPADPNAYIPMQVGVDGAAVTAFDLTPYFDDIDGDALTLSINPADLPTGLIFDGTSISGTLSADASQNGVDGIHSIPVTVTDGNGSTFTTYVTYAISNLNPIAENDGAGGDENATVMFDVFAANALTADSDPDGDTFTITRVASGNDVSVLGFITNGTGVGSVISGSMGGLFTLNPDGSASFDPGTDFDDLAVGQIRITEIVYQIDDGQGGTDTAVVTYTVTGQNDAIIPVIPGDPAVQADRTDFIPPQNGEDNGVATPLNLADYFTDPDATDALSFAVDPANLPAGLVFTGGVLSGTFDQSASQDGLGGVYDIPVTVTDGNGDTFVTTITYTITNPAPDAVNDTLSTPEETPITANIITGSDSDPDGDSLVIDAAALPDGSPIPLGMATILPEGTLTVEVDGTVTFNPAENFNGDLVFGYTVSDGEGGTDIATVTITVTPVNDAPHPVIPGDSNPPADPNNFIPVQAGVDNSSITPLDLSAYFADVDGDAIALSIDPADLPAGLTFDGTTLSGTPDGSASQGGNDGTYVIPVTASDGNGGTFMTTVTIIITNPAPDAMDDVEMIEEGRVLSQSVLTDNVNGADIDPDGDALTVTLVNNSAYTSGSVITLPSGALLTMRSDGSYDYDPNGQFETLADGETATDSFIYAISDGEGGSDTATVAITIIGENDAPIPVDPTDPIGPVNPQNYIPAQYGTDGAPVTAFNLLTYFGDPDGSDTVTLSIDPVDLPDGLIFDGESITGTLSTSASQGGTDGVYIIPVTATDSNGATFTTLVRYTVTNPAPDAVDDVLTTPEDTPLQANIITANDSDPDGDSLTIDAVSLADGTIVPVGIATVLPQGTLTVSADGTVNFVPAQDAFGSLVFGYTVTDNEGGTDVATVTINITPVNDTPIPVDPQDGTGPADPQNYIPGQVVVDGTAVPPLDLTPYFGDPDPNEILTISVDPNALPPGLIFDGTVISGTLDPSASQGGNTLTPGIYEVPVTVTDPSGETFTTIVTYTVGNPAPIAVDDGTVVVTEDTSTVIDIIGNDIDPDGDNLTITEINGTPVSVGDVITLPSGGSVTVGADGTVSYTPAENYNGADSFSYTMTDSEGGTDMASVTLDVIAVNDAPQITPRDSDSDGQTDPGVPNSVLPSQTGTDGAPITSVDVSTGFFDIDNSALTYSAEGLPTGLSIDEQTGLISGTIAPGASRNGPYTVMITATDPDGLSIQTPFIWTIDNTAPVIDVIETTPVVAGEPLQIDVSSVTSDQDGDTLTYSATGLPPGLMINPQTGLISGVPIVPQDTPYTFTVYADDGEGGIDSRAITLAVNEDGFVMLDQPDRELPQFRSEADARSDTGGYIDLQRWLDNVQDKKETHNLLDVSSTAYKGGVAIARFADIHQDVEMRLEALAEAFGLTLGVVDNVADVTDHTVTSVDILQSNGQPLPAGFYFDADKRTVSVDRVITLEKINLRVISRLSNGQIMRADYNVNLANGSVSLGWNSQDFALTLTQQIEEAQVAENKDIEELLYALAE